MDRETALSAALAALVVLGLGVAAATLDSTVDPTEASGLGPGTADQTGPADGSDSTVISSPGDASQLNIEPLGFCAPGLQEPPVLGGLALLLVIIFAAMWYSSGSALLSGAGALGVSLPVLLLWFLLAFCQPPDSEPAEFALGAGSSAAGDLLQEAGGATGSGSAAETVTTAPTAIFGLLLVGAVLASAVLLFTTTADDVTTTVMESDSDEESRADVTALGNAAGKAADRIRDDADVTNEVYRAWSEMTGYVEVDAPQSSTPAEFATAAVEAGVDPDDIDALTDVFEEVRYGGASATPAREREAIEALRRIERRYGGER